jgi:hypothetical protein
LEQRFRWLEVIGEHHAAERKSLLRCILQGGKNDLFAIARHDKEYVLSTLQKRAADVGADLVGA